MIIPPVIVIVGAGPAGLSAALWLKNLGLTPVVIERESVTGGMQNFNFLQNDWVLGQVDASGLSMAERYRQHIEKKSIDVRLQTHLRGVSRVGRGRFLLALERADEKSSLECDGVLIANGTRYMGKDILSSQINVVANQNIIEGPYAFVSVEAKKNKKIVIVGAGDNAFENAAMLLQQGCEVFVIARSSPSAQRKFLDKVQGHPRATIVENAVLHTAEKSKTESDSAEKIDINVRCQLLSVDNAQKHDFDIPAVDCIHVLAGYQANTDSIAPLITSGLNESLVCDENQFLQVDGFGRTNISRIYAAGDICNTDFPCVVSAVSSGALAAKTISQDLLC